MHKLNRTNYFNLIKSKSISIFYAGQAPHLSHDAFYPFHVNKNFWYLSGIDQEKAILVMVKSEVQQESYLFIEKINPEKALWVGETLTFEKAADLAELPLENIKDITTFKSFMSLLLSQTRSAIHGDIEAVYFDLFRLGFEDDLSFLEKEVQTFTQKYPYLKLLNAHPHLIELRSVKSEKEIKRIQGAIEISNQANKALLDALKKVDYEYELEAEFNYVLNKHHTTPAFGSIVAGGKNATILHYEHNKDKLTDGELVLLDLGVRYQYYASDITRTYPKSGQFTDRQKEIYQAVLNVNKAIIKWVKAGVTQLEYNQKGKALLIQEAKRIGLIQEESEITQYYYHSLGHALGLDVHDVTNAHKPFKVGQIITVEPGLYIAEEKIGVRIEDNLLLTKDGCINLSKDIIKEIDEIESYLKDK